MRIEIDGSKVTLDIDKESITNDGFEMVVNYIKSVVAINLERRRAELELDMEVARKLSPDKTWRDYFYRAYYLYLNNTTLRLGAGYKPVS